jgi:pimeloyl-ACP methyl ester carboxylesterase
MIFDRLQQALASQDIIAVGFSLGTAIAVHLAGHRPVTGLILVTRPSTRWSSFQPSQSTGLSGQLPLSAGVRHRHLAHPSYPSEGQLLRSSRVTPSNERM